MTPVNWVWLSSCCYYSAIRKYRLSIVQQVSGSAKRTVWRGSYYMTNGDKVNGWMVVEDLCECLYLSPQRWGTPSPRQTAPLQPGRSEAGCGRGTANMSPKTQHKQQHDETYSFLHQQWSVFCSVLATFTERSEVRKNQGLLSCLRHIRDKRRCVWI